MGWVKIKKYPNGNYKKRFALCSSSEMRLYLRKPSTPVSRKVSIGHPMEAELKSSAPLLDAKKVISFRGMRLFTEWGSGGPTLPKPEKEKGLR